MDTLIILCAKYLIWVVVVVAVLYVLGSTDKARLSAFAAGSLALGYALGTLAGKLWYDPRPFVESGIVPLISHAANNGFPSDHMLLGAAIASVAFVYSRPLGIVLGVLALLVGISRVLAGVHHFVDVAGAAAIAVCAVAIAGYAIRRFWPAGSAGGHVNS